jgi:hypothetical protein
MTGRLLLVVLLVCVLAALFEANSVGVMLGIAVWVWRRHGRAIIAMCSGRS